MAEESTVGELFTMAIEAERLAEVFYRRLAELFAAQPDVAAFWLIYAQEEAGHAQWLTEMRDRQPVEQLFQSAEKGMLAMAGQALAVSLDELVARVKNLEDAYQLANELEGGETNAVCEFLIDHFADNEKTQAFLRVQLKHHISRMLTDFPTQFRGIGVRRSILAVHKA